jgi:ELWxxDGT repeat protein
MDFHIDKQQSISKGGEMRNFHWRINKVGVLMVALALFALPALSTQVAYMVKDINPGDSITSGLWRNGHTNGTIFFSVYDGSSYWLWKSDGTPNGTVPVKAFSNLTYSSGPGWFTNVNGTIFFFIENNGGWDELWISDGTDAGTVSVYSFSSTFRPVKPTAVGSNLYFAGPGYDLWISDGTATGTTLVDSFNYIVDMDEMNGTLFFTAQKTSSTNQSLYQSDGTTAPLVYDINDWNLLGLTNVNGTLFFKSGGSGSNQLWKSDGSDTGTSVVKSFSDIGKLANGDGTLYLIADDGYGNQLWKSDGTYLGTTSISPLGVDVRSFENVNGTLFFAASDIGEEGTRELWKIDLTTGNTFPIMEFRPGFLASCAYMIGLDNTLFFPADDASGSGSELWKSDGTYGGTLMVKDINPGPPDSYPGGFINANGTLFFPANDGTHGTELWSVIDIPADVSPIVAALPDTAFKNKGSKKAALKKLKDIDQLIANGDFAGAIIELQDLRKRVDGFETGSAADKNDWIKDEEAQAELRERIDLLIAGLS